MDRRAAEETRRMHFRIRSNLSDTLAEGSRSYENGVNVAARMDGLAEAGEICISGTLPMLRRVRSPWNTGSWVNTKSRKANDFERYSELRERPTP